MMSNRATYITLFIIILCALLLRIYPATANMPYMYWHDENNYIESAMRFGSGNFNPLTFSHGGLYQLILFIAFGAYYLLERIIGSVHSPLAFYVNYIKDPTPFFVIARGISIFCGTGAAFLSYLIAARIYNKRVGLTAALFTSFSLLTVQVSSLALADTAAVFILLASFFILIRSIENPDDARMYYVSCLLVGMAVACKYYAVFGVVSVYMAAFMKSMDRADRWRRFLRFSIIGSFCVFIGFAAGMPFFLVRFADFYKDTFVRMGGEYIVRNPNSGSWLFYFTHHLRNGFGIPLEVLAIAGIAYAFYKRTRWDMLLLSFPVAYYLLFMHSIGYAYHMLPAAAFVLILAARLLDSVSRGLSRKYSTIILICASILVVMPTFLEAVKFVKVIAGPDTRTQSMKWIENNLPQNSSVLAEGYLSTVGVHTPPIGENIKTLKRDLADTMRRNGSGFGAKVRIENSGLSDGGSRTYDVMKVDVLTTEDLDAADPDYVVLTSQNDRNAGAELGYYVEAGYPDKRRRLRGRILERFALIKSFSPTREFTMWFPHLVDHDYRVIRSISLYNMKDFIRGPRIDIYERKRIR